MTPTLSDVTNSAAAAMPAPDWDALRRMFPALDKLTFINVAQKAVLPRTVEAAIAEWMSDVYATTGQSAFSMAPIEETRKAVARTFGMPARDTALVKNTSEGINIIAQGFPWQQGDNVVISEFEHENNTFPWRHLRERGVAIRFAQPDAQGRITVDAYRETADARTRIVAVAWVAYGNGFRADIAGLAEFCRGRGIKLVVDGVQGVGVISTPISELGCDALVAGGHKAQFSLAGAGFMYMKPEMTGMVTPPYAAKFSYASNDRTIDTPVLASDAHRFEYGNPNFLGVHVQRRSAEFLAGIGLAHIENRVKELTTQLFEAAMSRQIRVRTPKPWHERAGIVSFDLGQPAAPVVARLASQGIIVSEKDGFVRASVHFYNNADDIERLVEALAG